MADARAYANPLYGTAAAEHAERAAAAAATDVPGVPATAATAATAASDAAGFGAPPVYSEVHAAAAPPPVYEASADSAVSAQAGTRTEKKSFQRLGGGAASNAQRGAVSVLAADPVHMHASAQDSAKGSAPSETSEV